MKKKLQRKPTRGKTLIKLYVLPNTFVSIPEFSFSARNPSEDRVMVVEARLLTKKYLKK